VTAETAKVTLIPRAQCARRTVSTLLIIFMFALTAHAQRLPDGFFPESLTTANDGTLFAGSATRSEIVRITPGAATSTPFIPPGAGGLMSVQGLLADDASMRLFVCNADLGVAASPKVPSALLAFDLKSGKLRGRWKLPGGGLCNDIARAADRALYVSDSANARILKLDPRTSKLTAWLEHPLLGGAQFNGNGITIDGGYVYLSTFSDGRLLRVPILPNGRAGEPVQLTLPRPLAGADALRTLAPGKLLAFENDIAGGNGRVTIIDTSAMAPKLITVAEGLDEPVSGIVRNNQVIVVESQFRKLFGTMKAVPPAHFKLRTIALPQSGIDLTSIALPDGAAYPNGIAATPNGGLYVGFITEGKLLHRDAGGAWSTLHPGSEHVFAGTSLRLDAKRALLWGASPDFLPEKGKERPHRLFSFDLATGKLRDSLPLPDAGFGNDIALTHDGAVFVTDSLRGRIWRRATGSPAWTIVAEHPLLKMAGGIGAAGIARSSDGRLIVGNFGTGKLAVLDMAGMRELALPRLIENPDGLAFAPDGSLLVVEGAHASGDGKLLRIVDPFAESTRPVEVLAHGLDSPVNLSVAPTGEAYVTESRIRHRMAGNEGIAAPSTFRMVVLQL
jgi:DNA-binding beta-propeller fold protein YncE